jgi:hypothetical protein
MKAILADPAIKKAVALSRRTLQIINNAPYFRLSFLADFLLRNV